jgi:hypothetical protein
MGIRATSNAKYESADDELTVLPATWNLELAT